MESVVCTGGIYQISLNSRKFNNLPLLITINNLGGVDPTNPWPNNSFGHGRINIARALAAFKARSALKVTV